MKKAISRERLLQLLNEELQRRLPASMPENVRTHVRFGNAPLPLQKPAPDGVNWSRDLNVTTGASARPWQLQITEAVSETIQVVAARYNLANA